MKAAKYTLALTNAEYRLMIRGLIHWRNKLLVQGRCTEPVDELLLRLQKPRRWRHG